MARKITQELTLGEPASKNDYYWLKWESGVWYGHEFCILNHAESGRLALRLVARGIEKRVHSRGENSETYFSINLSSGSST